MQNDCIMGVSYAAAGRDLAGACVFNADELCVLYMGAATNVILMRGREMPSHNISAVKKMADLLRPFLVPEDEIRCAGLLSAMAHAENEGEKFIDVIASQVREFTDKTIDNL